MCGLTGFLHGAAEQSTEELTALVSRMARTMILRGPDDSGEWADGAAGVALGFRRLSMDHLG